MENKGKNDLCVRNGEDAFTSDENILNVKAAVFTR